MSQNNSPTSAPLKSLTSAEQNQKQLQDRLANASAIQEGLSEKDGIKTFNAPIKLDEQNYDAKITFGPSGFLVSMHGIKKFLNGISLGDSKIYKYDSSGLLEGKEGRRDPLVSGDKSKNNLAGIETSYSPPDHYGDLAIQELRVAKNKRILPKAG